ncbi:MAG TPA: UxaA family hydrolase [Verrucomicrobiae bacterium]|nr:UxaA family hydrolase [Verrucomicrobiae bacterium]
MNSEHHSLHARQLPGRVYLLPVPNDFTEPLRFDEAARVPASGDNTAIAVRTLPTGTRILIRQLVFEFAHTVLEGHRFALFRINKGQPLLSWGLPFGIALRDIEPGEYVCNEKILRVLSERHVEFELPKAPNFSDYRQPFRLDEANFRPGFRPGSQVAPITAPSAFQGFRRSDRRGAGTRNYIVVLGVSSKTAGFTRNLAARFKNVRDHFPNIDGVVAVEHTEGGSAARPNNFELTLRTLAGFMVNPNVGAMLCVDFPNQLLSNNALQSFLSEKKYPTDVLLHDFFSIESSFEQALVQAEQRLRSWLPNVNKFRREAIPLSELRLGLQCGGSDAFSGVSANPLVGILSRRTVACGGSANLAETDELIGAESYVLQSVRDLQTAQAFLEKLDRFQQWAAIHGHTAEGNPSGGNMFRGLYNISIKSIGAARKKDPATRLDCVIDFGELMSEPGFYFMDSPGNDLESIAGQVAAGCNMILFATGNGSITNFPFVPTIKIITTTRRFELVRNEMDFNAGRYLDGEPLEALGNEAFEQMLRVASGEPSVGEKAGHFQVQLWREWRQNGSGQKQRPVRNPVLLSSVSGEMDRRIIRDIISPQGERVALVLPTSLCSSQIARMIVDQLNATPEKSYSRAVALPHTEGCGNSGGEPEQLFMRTMAGYLAHPFVSKALLLEHGCEKTHNDAFRNLLRELGLAESNYGFASVQLDGGIERVTKKALKWFYSTSASPHGEPFSIGFAAVNASETLQRAFCLLAKEFSMAGGSSVLAEGLCVSEKALVYGERFRAPGAYMMECPTDDLGEILTGLGASGMQMLLAFESETIVPSNPLVPTIQVALTERLPQHLHSDVDLLVSEKESGEEIAGKLLHLIGQVKGGQQTPRSRSLGNTAFQITRGYTGISL